MCGLLNETKHEHRGKKNPNTEQIGICNGRAYNILHICQIDDICSRMKKKEEDKKKCIMWTEYYGVVVGISCSSPSRSMYQRIITNCNITKKTCQRIVSLWRCTAFFHYIHYIRNTGHIYRQFRVHTIHYPGDPVSMRVMQSCYSIFFCVCFQFVLTRNFCRKDDNWKFCCDSIL